MTKVLKKIWAGWKRVAHKIARVQTKILVTLFYFVLIAPVGAIFRLFGWDPLEVNPRKRRQSTNWKPAKQGEPDIESMRRQS